MYFFIGKLSVAQNIAFGSVTKTKSLTFGYRLGRSK